MTLTLGVLILFILVFIAVLLAGLAYFVATKVNEDRDFYSLVNSVVQPKEVVDKSEKQDSPSQETHVKVALIPPIGMPDYELMHDDGTPTGHYVTAGSYQYKHAIERGYALRRVE